MRLDPGTRFGAYEILEPLGAGAMGEVYRARDPKLGREVAIKVLKAGDPERLRRFEQGARAASALNHPNVVTLYEVGEHEGTPYVAMEYVEGRTLREALEDGPLPNDELIRYGTQMAEGLAKAHEGGVVHRDLKPENVVVSRDGSVKILGFGLAELMPRRDAAAEPSTLDPGSVRYSSPEQARGEPADFRSDQFSLGAILYEMATGRRAFEKDAPAETLLAVLREEPDPITLANPKLSPNVAAVIHRCLAKNAEERYGSTWEIAREIHAEALQSPREPVPRRSLALIAAVAIFFVLLILLLSVFVSGVQRS